MELQLPSSLSCRQLVWLTTKKMTLHFWPFVGESLERYRSHYSDITAASWHKITGHSHVCSMTCSGQQTRKYQSSPLLTFCKGINPRMIIGFLINRVNNAEIIYMSQHHHGYKYHLVQFWSWHIDFTWQMYRQTSNIICTLVGNKMVDHSDIVGASPVGTAPTTSSFLI